MARTSIGFLLCHLYPITGQLLHNLLRGPHLRDSSLITQVDFRGSHRLCEGSTLAYKATSSWGTHKCFSQVPSMRMKWLSPMWSVSPTAVTPSMSSTKTTVMITQEIAV